MRWHSVRMRMQSADGPWVEEVGGGGAAAAAGGGGGGGGGCAGWPA